MNQVTMESLLIMVGIEVAVLFALTGAFLLWRIKKGKKTDRKAAQTLVENVKSNEKNRREGLLKVFKECYEMEEDELNAAVDEFLNRERAFYKTLISVYVDRDASEFSKMTGALEEMVKPYSDLALSAEASVDSNQLDALQEQNKNLEKELGESKQVMDELLSEYTATFDKKSEEEKLEAIQAEPVVGAPTGDVNIDESLDIQVEETPANLDSELSITEEVEDESISKVSAVEINEATEEKSTANENSELDNAADEAVKDEISDHEIASELIIDETESVSTEPPKKDISPDETDNKIEAVENIDAELSIDEVSLDEMDTGLEIIEETEVELIIDEAEALTPKVSTEKTAKTADNEVSLDELNVELETVE